MSLGFGPFAAFQAAFDPLLTPAARNHRNTGLCTIASGADRLVYHLPKPGPDRRTELTLTPLELIDRLAALIPPPHESKTKRSARSPSEHETLAPTWSDRLRMSAT